MAAIRIGTRASALALKQTEMVIDELKKYAPDNTYTIVEMITRGDRQKEKPLYEFGGKSAFVEEFENALISGEIDMAIHSSKDMPMELAKGLTVGGVLKADSPRDVLLYKKGKEPAKKGFIIGSSSLRRTSQAGILYPDAQFVSLRGNVNTRINKLKKGEYDGIILAEAGLSRMGLLSEEGIEYRYFDVEEMIPAAGQGIIAIETGKAGTAFELAAGINDKISFTRLKYERMALKLLQAGCHEPVGIHLKIDKNRVSMYGINDGGCNKKKVVARNIDREDNLEQILSDITEELVREIR